MRVGVFGATGQVGGVMRRLLDERNYPVDEIRYFASSRSAGKKLPWKDGEVVVEDNATNRIVIHSMLSKMGLQVAMAEDGQQGVWAVQGEQSFDLVLMDIQMPVMDGRSATQAIREWERQQQRPHLPIIALTADAYEADRQQALAAGMNDFLAKPILYDALHTVLLRWLPQPG